MGADVTDNRFKDYPMDARFPSLGVDVRFKDWPVDNRFRDGLDTQFEGPSYGADPGPTAPTLSGLPDLSVPIGTGVTVNCAGYATGSGLSWSMTGPAWLSINAATGQITGTAPGAAETGTATVTAANGGGSSSDSFAVTVTAAETGLIWQPIVLIGASNIAGGSPSGTLDADLDAGAQLLIMQPSSGTVAPINIAAGIPRPGGTSTVSTTPGIAFAKAWAAAEANSNVRYVIIPTAVGGRGVMAGGLVAEQGPWDPDGTGSAWAIGGSGEETKGWGALYKAQTNFKAALDAAATAAGATLRGPVFVGHPMNENDAANNWAQLLDKAARCMTGIRAQWSAPNAPWVLSSAPPEWTYAGALMRSKITAINKELQSRLPYVAWVDGVVGFQSSEDIHFNNAGLRAQGAALYAALATAQARSTPMVDVIDSTDALTNKPQRAYGFYRLRSAYSGPVATISNGTTTADIYADAQGYPDYAAIKTFAGTGSAYVTVMYDQMGSGATMVPEGAGTAQIVLTGDIVTQGLRVGWGNGTNANMLKDTSYTVLSGGALFAVGRVGDAGSPVMAAGVAGSQAIFRSSGASGYSSNGVSRYLDTNLEWEPAWVVAIGSSAKGKTLHACMATGGVHYANGAQTPAATSASFTYTSVGLGWGGRIGATNRYHVGTQVALMAWDVAPTGADLTTLLAQQARWAW